MNRQWRTELMILATLAVATGCQDRGMEIAQQAADRQAQQNTAMADLNKEVARGARELVAGDAQARTTLLEVHQALQAERERLDRAWDDLQHDRRSLAQDRQSATLLAGVFTYLGATFLAAMLLGFCWYVLVALRADHSDEAALSSWLLHELAADYQSGSLPAWRRGNCPNRKVRIWQAWMRQARLTRGRTMSH